MALVKQPLELHEAVAITTAFRNSLELLPTVKTDQFKHYYPYIEVTPAIATAVCILEYHRIREDDSRLFTIRQADSDRIRQKFDDIPLEYKSTKATKTLASLIHAKAEESGRKNSLFLVSTARSHILRNSFSETTAIYLQESQLEGKPREIARYVCERGVFGWLYVAFLQYINGDIGSLSQATTQVSILKKRLSPEQIERIADFLQYADMEQESILHQLSEYTRDDIAAFLMNIGTQNTASTQPETFCILGKSCSLLRTEATACLRCSCSLKTNYTLDLIGKKLMVLLSRMKPIAEDNIVERQKLTFQVQQLLFVLMDAKIWYDKYDKHFLRAYVDIPQIQSMLYAVPDHNFLLLNEEAADGSTRN